MEHGFKWYQQIQDSKVVIVDHRLPNHRRIVVFCGEREDLGTPHLEKHRFNLVDPLDPYDGQITRANAQVSGHTKVLLG